MDDLESQRSPSKSKLCQEASLDDEIIAHDPEPTHGYVARCIFCLLSLSYLATAGYLFTHYIFAPLEYLAFVSAKCTLCACCCPISVGRTFRNIALTPFRWARLAILGIGHIECWNHPVWPFRPSSKSCTK